MKKILLTCLCLALGGLAPGALHAAEDAALNQPAPALKFKDLASGKEVSLTALKGKVVVVDFWATWCGPCKAEIPGYIQLQEKYGKDGLVIIGVSLDQKGPGAVKRFVKENGMNYTVVMGSTDDLDALSHAPGTDILIPTTFLIDRTGKVVHHKAGAMDHAAYEAIVKPAL